MSRPAPARSGADRAADRQLASGLGRRAGTTPADPDQLRSMAAALWHQRGVVVLWPAEISDAWTRQAITNEAARQYGPGREEGKDSR